MEPKYKNSFSKYTLIKTDCFHFAEAILLYSLKIGHIYQYK